MPLSCASVKALHRWPPASFYMPVFLLVHLLLLYVQALGSCMLLHIERRKKKTDYMLMDTRSRLSVPHMPKICPSFYYPVVKQNEQNPSTEFDIRPHHLTGPHSTCEITTNCCRWIYSLISSSHRRAHWGHEQPDLCGNTRTSTLLKLEGVTVGSLHCIVLIYLPTQ